MLKHIKAFLNVQFKISEVEDDVYSSDSESEGEEEEPEGDQEEKSSDESQESEKPKVIKQKGPAHTFPKSFIFSCIGIGLTNIARKTE